MGEENQSFYMVMRDSGACAPVVRHSTKEEAETEAARLLKKEGDSFYILKAVTLVYRQEPPVLKKDLV